MAVYVIVICAVVLVLVACYRAFGGAQRQPSSPGALLTAGHAVLVGNLAALDELITLQQSHPEAPGEDALRDGRRGAATIRQHLDLLPSAATLDTSDAAVQSLLAAAAEDVSWAWRVVAASGWSDNPGLQTAVTAMRDHAVRCAEQAAPLLSVALAPEPGEGC